MDEVLKQLDHEIRRHVAMAELTSGPIRTGHIQAAQRLTVLQEQIGGEPTRPESKQGNRLFLHHLLSWVKKAAPCVEKKSRGN